ncbi:MAG: hypothetical protein FWC68_01695 [Oscillospiraceae bacterium]|nr:hypothetical protein [Oscillospiraceae bacterium]
MDFLKELSPEELVLLSSTIAITLSKGLTKGETVVLASFVNSVGKDIGLIAFQKIEKAIEKKIEEKKNIKKELEK